MIFTPVTAPKSDRLLARLRQEITAGHVLWTYRQSLKVLGAADGTVLLVETADAARPFAVVRLEWAVPGLFRDADPRKPDTTFLAEAPEMEIS